MNTEIQQLTDLIRETAYSLHCYLRNGMLEKVYENGLAHRLRKQGIDVRQQVPISVKDEDGTVLGEYIADLVVQDIIIIELKATKAIADEHIAQVLAYLRATGIEHGVLVDFGAPKLQIKKLIL